MFNSFAIQGVDAIQGAKKQFVNTFVKHDELAKILNSFVDAQAEYTKSAIDAGIKAATGTVGILSDRATFAESTKKFQSYFDGSSVKKAK